MWHGVEEEDPGGAGERSWDVLVDGRHVAGVSSLETRCGGLHQADTLLRSLFRWRFLAM